MRRRIIVSPTEKRNVTIDRCPPIKSREICTCLRLPDLIRGAEIRVSAPKLNNNSKPNRRRGMFPVESRTEANRKIPFDLSPMFTKFSHSLNPQAIAGFQSTAGRACPLRPQSGGNPSFPKKKGA
jgi:hypothetical protein